MVNMINETSSEILNQKNNEIFYIPGEDKEKEFTDVEMTFLKYLVWDSQDWLKSNIKTYYSGNRARVLYEISDMIRLEVIQGDIDRIKKLDYKPYQDILSDAIYSADIFKIAEELLRQYEEHAGAI